MSKAEMHTDKGVMKIEFYDQDAPKTVKNFLTLAQKGFYDGTTFTGCSPTS
jgi:peptidyl-prolyl cis-trans isomerase B (cyclophilin B)